MIKETRENLRCSMAVFARKPHINERTLKKWEQGRANPNPQTDNVFVTLERHDKEVSVAKSCGDLLIRFVEKRSYEHPLGKTVAVRVPTSVVRSMLAGNSDQVNIGAGIRALTREGDVDVTVNDEKETVRVWTDTSTASD